MHHSLTEINNYKRCWVQGTKEYCKSCATWIPPGEYMLTDPDGLPCAYLIKSDRVTIKWLEGVVWLLNRDVPLCIGTEDEIQTALIALPDGWYSLRGTVDSVPIMKSNGVIFPQDLPLCFAWIRGG